jgi:hypothetical protein
LAESKPGTERRQALGLFEQRRTHSLAGSVRGGATQIQIDRVSPRFGHHPARLGHQLRIVAHHLHAERHVGQTLDLSQQVRPRDLLAGDAHELGANQTDWPVARQNAAHRRAGHALHGGKHERRRERKPRHW